MSLLLIIAIAAVALDPTEVAPTVSYGCDDLVVIGRMKNLSFESIPDENDLLGHGHVKFEVRIRKRLRGTDNRRVVPVSAIAHTYMNEEHEFLLVLSPSNDGVGYELEDVRVWQLAPGEYLPWVRKQARRPPLARRCT
jgi:hypothetical protein